MNSFTEEERALYEQINTDTLVSTKHELKLSTICELRMIECVRRLMSAPAEKERKILQELQVQKNSTEI